MMLESLQIAAATPEIFISTMACFILIYRLFDNSCCPNLMPFIMSVSTLLIAGFLTISVQPGTDQAYSAFGVLSSLGNGADDSSAAMLSFNGLLISDAMSVFIKAMIAFITAAVFIYGARYNADRGYFKTEFYVLGLFGVVGMMIMASSAHLLTLYIGLELLSLSLYAMVAFYKDSRVASEAAIKYFILGALASAILLYGMSLLYGLSGSLQIQSIAASLAAQDQNNIGITLAVVLIVVGLAFKLGAVPFHMWVPDVYQGSPTSVTAYLAAAPKLAAFAIVIRLLVDTLQVQHEQWQPMLIMLALASVSVGNIVAIAQKNIKRMLAYSTISHMGFFLFGILSGTAEGYGNALFYVVVYTLMSLGVFGVILLLSNKQTESERIIDFQGLSQRSPLMAFLMLVLMFSMAGIPPFAGFFAKLSVIASLIESGLVWVAIVAVLLAVIGAFYYLRIIKTMYFDAPDEALMAKDTGAENSHWAIKTLLAINVFALLLILPWIGRLIDLSQRLMGG